MAGRELDELIHLKSRVAELIKGYSALRDELAMVRSEKDTLADELVGKETELGNFKKEFDRVKLSGAMLGDGDEPQDAKKRINELVREIDNCIALLNNI
jgi:predicted  nucleic acid-binding Zn-ribbon protein